MKKIFLSIAIISASIFSSYAVTDTNINDGGKPRTECRKDSGEQSKDKRGKDGRGMRAFEGINLTDAQKAKIKALREEQRAQKEAAKKARGEKKENKESLTAEQRQQMRAEKQAKRQQAKENFNAKVKAILTPELYAKFLENTKEMAAHKDSKGMKMDGKRTKDGKGNRTDKGKKGQHDSGKLRRGNSQQG